MDIKTYSPNVLFQLGEEESMHDLKLLLNSNNTPPKSDINGPGVYYIKYKRKLIYIGKFQPYKSGNVLTTRW